MYVSGEWIKRVCYVRSDDGDILGGEAKRSDVDRWRLILVARL